MLSECLQESEAAPSSQEASDKDHLSSGFIVSKEVWATIHTKPNPAS